jgi:hypothetical protein
MYVQVLPVGPVNKMLLVMLEEYEIQSLAEASID